MRARLLVALFDATHRAYAQLRAHTRPAWGLDVDALRTFPTGSLGHELGEWLHARGYALMPHLETHDLMHVLTGIGTDVVSEVELQWLLAGNGKRSPYLIGAAALGAAVFPEALPRLLRAWSRGRRSPRLYDVGRDALGAPSDDAPRAAA